MASPKLLKNGTAFKVSTNLKGFKKYVIDRGLIQNRGLRLYISGVDEFDIGKPFSILAAGWPFEPRKSGRFTDYWIGAPRASTDSWMLAGWDGDDFIQGTNSGENELFGLGGADYIHGSTKKNDTIIGGDGNDKIYSYKGDDSIMGNNGSDVLSSGLGDDTLSGGDGNDSLFGAEGDDILKGGAGDDLLMGGTGENNLWGGKGADRFGLLKDADHSILDFDPSEGDRLLMRSMDMAKLDVSFSTHRSSAFFVFDLGKQGIINIQTKIGITVDDIMDSISMRI